MRDCDYCDRRSTHYLVRATDASYWPATCIGKLFWVTHPADGSCAGGPVELQTCGIHRRTAEKQLAG